MFGPRLSNEKQEWSYCSQMWSPAHRLVLVRLKNKPNFTLKPLFLVSSFPITKYEDISAHHRRSSFAKLTILFNKASTMY